MISSVSIENLRGIRSGKLQGLAPLTILTGVNGCGKSTVLDALLIAASPEPDAALGEAVARHPVTRNGARWLVGGAGKEREAKITVEIERDNGTSEQHTAELLWRAQVVPAGWSQPSVLDSLREPASEFRYRARAGSFYRRIGFGVDNQFVLDADSAHESVTDLPEVAIIDPGLPVSLNTAYSEAVRQGRKRDVIEVLRDIVPEVENIEILTEDDGTPALYLTTAEGSVPVSLSGDGVQSFLQSTLQMAARPGLVLVEEPEVYQHPRAIRQTAQVMLASMRRGVQIVATTHSLELIDGLIAEATDEELERLALFILHLEQGQLRSSRHAGKDMAFARNVMENDLR